MNYIEDTLKDEVLDTEEVSETCGRGRAYRRKSDEHHKQKLISSLESHSSRYCNVVYVKESKKGDKFLSRPKNSNRQQFHKKKSARRLRKAVDVPLKGNGARKLYDYKWEID